LNRELSRGSRDDGTVSVGHGDSGHLNGGLSRGSRDDGSRGGTNKPQSNITCFRKSLSLFVSFILKDSDIGLNCSLFRRVLCGSKALSLEHKVVVDSRDSAFNGFLVMAGKEREAELLELVSDEGDCIGLVLHVGMDRGNLSLNHTIVLVLFFSEISEVALQFSDCIIDNTSSGVNSCSGAFTGKTRRVQFKEEFRVSQMRGVSEIGMKGLSVLQNNKSGFPRVHREDKVLAIMRDASVKDTGGFGNVVVNIFVVEPFFNDLM